MVNLFNHDKRANGQYFTSYNPFENQAFDEWCRECNITNTTILEPFAGSNNLITMLQNLSLCNSFKSFDIEPQNKNIQRQDTLKDFPTGYKVCVTNPPYLAQNSASRRNIDYPATTYDDMYKFSLEKCLDNCDYVAAIIPASFINANIFLSRLSAYILLNTKMFDDTDHPVCLALFSKNPTPTKVYDNQKYLGLLKDLKNKLPNPTKKTNMRFNDKQGKLGLIAIDNTKTPSIKFCDGDLIDTNKVSHSSRSITRISIDADINKLIVQLNHTISSLRESTGDIFLTPFKGMRADNKYRRRLDYKLARDVINEVYFSS